jgi:hypothetical protein
LIFGTFLLRLGTKEIKMVAYVVIYIIDQSKIKELDHYGKLSFPLVEKFGGKHPGYYYHQKV